VMTKVGLRRSVIAVTALLGLLFLSAIRAGDPQQPGEGNAGLRDSFEEADLEFISLYTEARAATLAKVDPLIVVEMNSLVLIHDGKRTEAKLIPALYHHLKAVSHIPLAIYVALAPFGSTPLDADRLSRVRELRTRVVATTESLGRSGFNAEQSQRSRFLLERCMTFLDAMLPVRKYDPAELKKLTRAAGPIVLANAGDAARAQIDAYHTQVSAWRRGLPADQWAKLRVLVLGRQMARKHNVAVQYFAKLLGDTGESRRLVYAEELSGEQQGLDLLATHQLDSELSEAFFESPDRMEIDLLGNAASVYLDGFDFTR
jgi:hypothetical protein